MTPDLTDDDTRALAATLLGAGTDGSEPELAARLAEVLERVASATPDVPGDVGATLRRDLAELGGPEEAPPVRLTEVIPTATATGAWSAALPRLRKGTLVYKVVAVDRAANRSAAASHTQRVTRY